MVKKKGRTREEEERKNNIEVIDKDSREEEERRKIAEWAGHGTSRTTRRTAAAAAETAPCMPKSAGTKCCPANSWTADLAAKLSRWCPDVQMSRTVVSSPAGWFQRICVYKVGATACWAGWQGVMAREECRGRAAIACCGRVLLFLRCFRSFC